MVAFVFFVISKTLNCFHLRGRGIAGRLVHPYHAFESRSSLNVFILWLHSCFSCIWLRWLLVSWYLCPQFKRYDIHIFICILYHLRVHYDLTTWPAPSLLDSSVGRALKIMIKLKKLKISLTKRQPHPQVVFRFVLHWVKRKKIQLWIDSG